ncbi:MarR family winged helix-turn-helix transcriptional regulator [Paenibacillus sp. y28]|uniref:MarR family winged helix-turn-helix transcriptional regulator n=1 Tax=Paenibacillus sp. y28 TaxID=3129110 RepID=UPI00301690ED
MGSDFARTLIRLNKVFAAVAVKEFKQVGITMAQMFVLRQLFDRPKTIGEIAKGVDLSYSTVSGIVDRLERNRLVERVRDEQDRRVVWIRPTDDLRVIKERVSCFQEQLSEDLLQVISREELSKAEETLKMIVTYMEKKVEG